MNIQKTLSPEAQKDVEERWALENEAINILREVVSEWRTDAMSVQCFDLRIVRRAGEVIDRLNQLSAFL